MDATAVFAVFSVAAAVAWAVTPPQIRNAAFRRAADAVWWVLKAVSGTVPRGFARSGNAKAVIRDLQVDEISPAFDASFDLLVIGAGPGGLAAARHAARCGKRVLVLEAGGENGSTVYRSCVDDPVSSFTLPSSAARLQQSKLGGGSQIRFDGQKIFLWSRRTPREAEDDSTAFDATERPSSASPTAWLGRGVGGGSNTDRGILLAPRLEFWQETAKTLGYPAAWADEASSVVASLFWDSDDKKGEPCGIPVALPRHRSPLSWALARVLQERASSDTSDIKMLAPRELTAGIQLDPAPSACATPLRMRHCAPDPRRVHIADGMFGDVDVKKIRIATNVKVGRLQSHGVETTCDVEVGTPQGATQSRFVSRAPVIVAAGAMATPQLVWGNHTRNPRDAVAIALVYQARPGLTVDSVNTDGIAAAFRTLQGLKHGVAAAGTTSPTDSLVGLRFSAAPNVEVTVVLESCGGGSDRAGAVAQGISANLCVFAEAFAFRIVAAFCPELGNRRRVDSSRRSLLGCASADDEAEVLNALASAVSWCREIVQQPPLCHLSTGREAIDVQLLCQTATVEGFPKAAEIARVLYHKPPKRITPTVRLRAAHVLSEVAAAAQDRAYVDAYVTHHCRLGGFMCGTADLPTGLNAMGRVYIGDASAAPFVCAGGGGNVVTSAVIGTLAATEALR